MVFKPCDFETTVWGEFENDVKMYGIQTVNIDGVKTPWFENDVKMYGIQTGGKIQKLSDKFENDVKMYGIQTKQWVSEL